MTYYRFLVALVLLVLATPAYAEQMRNGLPPTSMDSFVHEANEQAELIYGGEGVDGPPKYYGFTYDHRINSGIFDRRDAGLTTGHGAMMPDAWGADEFLDPPNGEWSRSGANGGNSQHSGAEAHDQWDAEDPARNAAFARHHQAQQHQQHQQQASSGPPPIEGGFPFPDAGSLGSAAEGLLGGLGGSGGGLGGALGNIGGLASGGGVGLQSMLGLNSYQVTSVLYSPTMTWEIGGDPFLVYYGTPAMPTAIYIPVEF